MSILTAQLSGAGLTQLPEAEAVQRHKLRFEDEADGAIAVIDHASEQAIYRVAPGSNGFIRGVLRGLARERKRRDISRSHPFHLVFWSDGRLSLHDPTTDQQIALEAFGPTNAQAFVNLVAANLDNTRSLGEPHAH